MKKIIVVMILIVSYALQAQQSINFDEGASQESAFQNEVGLALSVTAQESMKVPILIAIVGSKKDTELNEVAQTLKKACEFTSEVSVIVRNETLPKRKKDLQGFEEEGFMRVCYLMHNKKAKTIEWRLYDPSEVEMLLGKSHKMESEPRYAAYHIADEMWPELTGQDGFFSTCIAYSVKIKTQKKHTQEYKHIKHIYICDYDGSHPKCIIDTPTLNVAPRWGSDTIMPNLYYSQCTASNMQLIQLDEKGRKKIVLNADGLNMLPSFSPSGNGVAYNYSGNIMVKRIDDKGKVSYNKVTQNSANNVSPNLLDNGDVIFCSDFQTKNPQIYYYDAKTQQIERITKGGFCNCPSYCSLSNKIVYARLINGVSQLFIYDLQAKEHKQITFDSGHKDEPSFSPCGNLVVFSIEQAGKSRLCVMHLVTKERHFITNLDSDASYGSWSGRLEIWSTFSTQ